jgi:hypothetical protein
MGVISFRPDAEVSAALDELGEAYGNQTQTLRTAVLTLLAERRRADLRAEALRVASDPEDLAEMQAVREQMDELRAW